LIVTAVEDIATAPPSTKAAVTLKVRKQSAPATTRVVMPTCRPPGPQHIATGLRHGRNGKLQPHHEHEKDHAESARNFVSALTMVGEGGAY
jgi:hypothetical protein